jgi:hypothetical protein
MINTALTTHLTVVAAQYNMSTGRTRIIGPFVDHSAFIEYLELLAEAWGLSREDTSLVDSRGHVMIQHIACTTPVPDEPNPQGHDANDSVAVFAITAVTGEPFLAAVCRSRPEAEKVVAAMDDKNTQSVDKLEMTVGPEVSEYLLAPFEDPIDIRLLEGEERSTLLHALRRERMD